LKREKREIDKTEIDKREIDKRKIESLRRVVSSERQRRCVCGYGCVCVRVCVCVLCTFVHIGLSYL